MKIIKLTAILVLLAYHTSYASNCFTTISNGKSVALDQHIYEKPISIKPFSDNLPIYGLCISGDIEQLDTDYLVRVILNTSDNHKYCVFEAYPTISGDKTITFNQYCEETALLDGVFPSDIKIVLKNAKLTLSDIRVVEQKPERVYSDYINSVELIKKTQTDSIINKINKQNKIHKRLWRAGPTKLSQMKFEDKLRMLGISEEESTWGFEYYWGGIFEAGTPDSLRQRPNSNFVGSFDWRNRHGKNWTTSVKDQGNSNFCYSFGSIATIESLCGLYYNRYNTISTIDLSEEEGGRCTYAGVDTLDHYITGGHRYDMLGYVWQNGICDEAAYQFVDTCCLPCRRDDITPNEVVRIQYYGDISDFYEDSIKSALIKKGPLVSGFMGHCMELVGYKTIQAGDVISYFNTSGLTEDIEIVAGNPWIGSTCWIFKGNEGLNCSGHINGYCYILFQSPLLMGGVWYIDRPYFTIDQSKNTVICEDRDGDGYYFWGLGLKPTNCPSWVPDEADGDDSDISYGPMNRFGYLDYLSCGQTIKTAVSYNYAFIFCRMGIVNGGTVTINGTTTMYDTAKIRVCEGGTLIIDGGTINNAIIDLVPGGTLVIKNGGVINMANGYDFHAPIGAVVTIENGEIN